MLGLKRTKSGFGARKTAAGVLSVMAAFSIFTARAQVAIYKHKLTGTVTGNGTVQRVTIFGYTILDLATADCVQILRPNTPEKTYRIERWDNFSANYLESESGKQVYLLVKQRAELDGAGNEVIASAVYKGPCTLTEIGAATKFSIPTSLAMTGHTSFVQFSNPCLEEMKGTLTLDVKRTRLANRFGDKISVVVQRLIQENQGQDYRAVD